MYAQPCAAVNKCTPMRHDSQATAPRLTEYSSSCPRFTRRLHASDPLGSSLPTAGTLLPLTCLVFLISRSPLLLASCLARSPLPQHFFSRLRCLPVSFLSPRPPPSHCKLRPNASPPPHLILAQGEVGSGALRSRRPDAAAGPLAVRNNHQRPRHPLRTVRPIRSDTHDTRQTLSSPHQKEMALERPRRQAMQLGTSQHPPCNAPSRASEELVDP